MNKLDGKLIVDREFALQMLNCLDLNDPDHGEEAKKLHEIINTQDNTGWAAVPVEHTSDMHEAATKALEESICDDIETHLIWKNGADEKVHLVSCLGRTYRAMLNASPPLGGGG